MSKSMISVFVLALAASLANAHDPIEPLFTTSLRRVPDASRSDRVVSLLQKDTKSYAAHKEVLDVEVAGGNMGYLAKVPAAAVINDPEVQDQIHEAEDKAIDAVKGIANLDSDVDSDKIVHEIESIMIAGAGMDKEEITEKLAKMEPDVDEKSIKKVVGAVLGVAKEEKKELFDAMEEAAEECEGQERFDILMCDSHMCTKCVLAYCMEQCQETQKMFPTCRCKDWPKSRKSYSGGDFEGKGKYVTQAGIQIADAYAYLSEHLDVSVASLKPVNYGDAESPVGGLDVQVSVSSHGLFEKTTKTCTMTVKGDGSSSLGTCESGTFKSATPPPSEGSPGLVV